MAAIFGAIAISPGVDLPAIADRMQARLAYRAPDGFGRWTAPDCVLGHGALRLDQNAEVATQPLRLADGRLCVVDGYVANFDEVRRKLDLKAGAALDDAMLVAYAVERWGGDFADHLHGEFVAAIWNPKTSSLVLVRDHLGGRPICYVQTPHVFAFATSAAALLRLPGLATSLDPLGVVTLWYGEATYLEQDHTPFVGISAVPPGHRLTWRCGDSAKLSRYWRLQPHEPYRRRDEREYVEAFREVFGGAVARAMRGSADTALMLSGGIDSGAILAARRGFRENGVADDLLCVSAVLSAGDYTSWAQEENRNILAMTERHPRKAQFGVPVLDTAGSRVTPADLAEIAWSWIHPMDASLLVPSMSCSVAKREGSRLIMNGVDGDNMTNAGVFYIDALLGAGHLQHAWSESRHAAKVNTFLRGMSPLGLFVRATVAALEPAACRRLRDRLRTRRSIRHSMTHSVMSPALAEQVDLARRLRAACASRGGTSNQLRSDHLAYWLGFSLSGSDAIVARHGMEARHPWCDLQVLAFFQRLPVDYLTRYGWTKWVVRQACEQALGEQVVWHSGKRHLGALLNQQVLEDAAPYLHTLLMEQRHALQAFVRDDAMAKAIRLLSAPRLLTDGNCDNVLTIVTLAGWVRHAQYLLINGDG